MTAGPLSGTVVTMSDPRAEPQPILASDAARERSMASLSSAVAEGRRTQQEFSERVDLAQVARTDLEKPRSRA